MRVGNPSVSLALIVTLLASPPLSAATPAPQQRLADLVRVRLVDGSLQFEWLGRQLPPDRPVAVSGPEARWTIRSPRPLRGVPPGSLELVRHVAATRDPDSFWWIGISSTPQRLSITAHRGGRVAVENTLRFSQAVDGGVELHVQDNFNRTFTRVDAADLIELRQKHPQLVRQTLVPLLRQLAGHDPLLPGASDVYRVFDEISPEGAAQQSVESLLGDLANPSFEMRQRATVRLAQMGAPAVLVILRMDRRQLHPEQQVRLENLLETNSNRSILDPAALRSDAAFLADCMEFHADQRIQMMARSIVEQVLGKPIPLHASPTEAEWAAAADLVRERIAAGTRDER